MQAEYFLQETQSALDVLGERLRAARALQGISQEELAAFLGLRQSVVSLYENGKEKLPLSLLPKIADHLKVSMTYLLCPNHALNNMDDISFIIHSLTQLLPDEIPYVVTFLTAMVDNHVEQRYRLRLPALNWETDADAVDVNPTRERLSREELGIVPDDAPFLRVFGERLRALRLAHGWTEAQVAEALGVIPDVIWYMESGEMLIELDFLPQLTHIFSVPHLYFFLDVDPSDENLSFARILVLLSHLPEPEWDYLVSMMGALVRTHIARRLRVFAPRDPFAATS